VSNHASNIASFNRTLRTISIVLVPLALAALACNFGSGEDPSLRETDIAIGIQQTLLAQTSSAMQAGLTAATSTLPAVQATASPPQPTIPPSPTTIEVATQPIISTSPAEPSSTPTSLAPQSIQLTDWEYIAFRPINSGCKLDDAPCWLLRMSGSGMWKSTAPTEGTMTTQSPIFIDPAWGNPALVFWHNFQTKGFGYRVNLQIDRQWSEVRRGDAPTTGWVQEVINLKDYKGENLSFNFTSTVVVRFLTPNISVNWYIQDVQIVPDYKPSP